MKRISLVLPVLLLATACGGSDGPKGLSKADFVAQAEAICKKANADIDALGTPSDLAGIAGFLDKLVKVADDATKALNELDAPEADEADLEAKFLTPMEKQTDEGKAFATKVKAAAAANDQKKLGELLADAPTMTEADLEWMKGYGFKECVESAETDE